ncbi:uncharacterized protein LOC116294102 [Actinia tenebrosa]|uniref:Uncharacterized protein LOC116294102 n=1 Tax=Actinia tenebrosa TaxID=6105 RepID=A0A6P8HQY5_ACTTE|nr:uncharacterized protein LOC116294102 [Actinia tenebrosa]
MTQSANTLLFLTFLGVICSFKASDEGWSYYKPNGPDTWSSNYPQCGGPQQSPVNIIPIQVKYDGMDELKIQYQNDTALNLSYKGKAIRGAVLSDAFVVTGAGLEANFRLKEFHFHVGSQNSRGSEHQISGKAFPMEVQLIHYDIIGQSSRALVLSVLFTLQNKDNLALNGIISRLQNCSCKGDSIIIPSFSVKSLLPKDITQFYRYSGSLTTPQCNDSEWLLFHETAPISERQLKTFREVHRDSPQSESPAHLVDNFRPVQPLNKRIVKRNFDHLQFHCGKKSVTTADCRQTVTGHDVFYEVEVQPCTLPVSINFRISVPVLGFEYSKTLFEDQRIPIPIANLNYGATTEMHFHSNGPRAGYLHVTVYQAPLSASQESNKTKVIDEYFQVNGVCQRANCSVDSWDKHWCTSTIGFGNDSLSIGFSSVINDPCRSSSMMVKIYRQDSEKKWTLTGIQNLVDKQTCTVNLTKSIVVKEDRNVVRSRRDVTMETRWSVVTMDAHIDKIPDLSLNFMLFFQTTYNGGHYLIFNESYIYPSGYCNSPKPGSKTGRKVAIGVSVVLVMLLIIGITGVLLYRNRKAYFGHRPALVDEIDIQDADTL